MVHLQILFSLIFYALSSNLKSLSKLGDDELHGSIKICAISLLAKHMIWDKYVGLHFNCLLKFSV